MVPSLALKKKLEEVGFPTKFEGDEQYPSLVAHMARFVGPNEVAEKLQQILRCHDWNVFYNDPDSNG
jgi:hypothetical protein